MPLGGSVYQCFCVVEGWFFGRDVRSWSFLIPWDEVVEGPSEKKIKYNNSNIYAGMCGSGLVQGLNQEKCREIVGTVQ